MTQIDQYLSEICTDNNKDTSTKSVERWIKDYFENPNLFLNLCSIFSENQIGKSQLIHGKSENYRINSFIYEHEDFTAIVRTYSPLYKGTRPANKIQVEILK